MKNILMLISLLFLVVLTTKVRATACATGSDCIGVGNDTCVDTGSDNIPDACIQYWYDCQNNIGKSCDTSLGTQGICVNNAGDGSCSNTPASGEHNTSLSGGIIPNFHSGNENFSCNTVTDLQICQSNPSGYNPSGDGICAMGSMCNAVGSTIVLNCGYDGSIACATSDVPSSGGTTSTTCGSNYVSWSCDTSTTLKGWEQDSLCVYDTGIFNYGCISSGFACNKTSLNTLYNNADNFSYCMYGEPCDFNFTDGNFDNNWGIINNSGVCIQNAGGASSCTYTSGNHEFLTNDVCTISGIIDATDYSITFGGTIAGIISFTNNIIVKAKNYFFANVSVVRTIETGGMFITG